MKHKSKDRSEIYGISALWWPEQYIKRAHDSDGFGTVSYIDRSPFDICYLLVQGKGKKPTPFTFHIIYLSGFSNVLSYVYFNQRTKF